MIFTLINKTDNDLDILIEEQIFSIFYKEILQRSFSIKNTKKLRLSSNDINSIIIHIDNEKILIDFYWMSINGSNKFQINFDEIDLEEYEIIISKPSQ